MEELEVSTEVIYQLEQKKLSVSIAEEKITELSKNLHARRFGMSISLVRMNIILSI